MPNINSHLPANLLPCPPPGSGVHSWIFYAACRCRECGLTADESVELITEGISRPAQPWREVEDAVTAAYKQRVSNGSARKAKWPCADQGAREACASENGGLDRLMAMSPVDTRGLREGSRPMLGLLFSGDPWICCGITKEQFYTKRLSAWGAVLEKVRLIVPSPMTGPHGYTQLGKLSAHSLDNTGPRCFLVVEQDTGCFDLQAGVLMELSKAAPLSLVVHSGSKSIHGWFYCNGQPEEGLLEWFKHAVALGADYKMWTRSQFTRMPWGIRENGQTQQVLFFNPRTIPQP